MTNLHLPRILIADDITDAVISYCKQNHFQSIKLVGDKNTYRVLGRDVQTWLENAGCTVETVIVEGNPVQAEGNAVLQLLTNTRHLEPVFIAVGSGTVTDLVRFCSFVLKRPFISIPTAPSVDAYTSPNSPLTVSGIKHSYAGHLPLAVFAHLPTLCAAPHQMILAGLGDILGKVTALADWELGSRLWDEPYDPEIAARSRLDMQRCIELADDIAARRPEAIHILVESLLDSGLNMARARSSRPASGAEHHLAHYWEMKLLWEGRPPILHGIKVGFSTLLVCDAYSRLRSIDRKAVGTWLQKSNFPDVKAQAQEIRKIYILNPEKILEEQKRFLELTPSSWKRLKERVYDQFEAIQVIADRVPTRSKIEQLLARIHFPITARELQLSKNDMDFGLTGAHYLRDRFTILKLLYYLTRV